MQTPSIGRIVRYVLADGPQKGESRAAMIVRVWSDTCVNLLVFLDGYNDISQMALQLGAKSEPTEMRVTSCSYDADRKPGCWFWTEFVPPKEK